MVDAGRAVDDSVCNCWLTEAVGGNYENKRNGAGVQCKLRHRSCLRGSFQVGWAKFAASWRPSRSRKRAQSRTFCDDSEILAQKESPQSVKKFSHKSQAVR